MTWELGCLIDETWGIYSTTRLLEIASGAGFSISTDDLMLLGRYARGEVDNPEVWEALNDLAVAAEDYLNEHHAPEGASFGWFDGGFYLWSDESWQEAC